MGIVRTIHSVYLARIVYLVSLYILGSLFGSVTVYGAQEQTELRLAVYTLGQSSFTDILTGKSGEAYLLYFTPQNGPERPLLVVHLWKEDTATYAVAEVFETPLRESHVPVGFVDDLPILSETLLPAVRLIALDGWWVREGLTNYNLDITVFGEMAAMWGATPDIKGGPQYNWPSLLGPGEPNAQIVVRDANSDGFPDWDWRTMLPEFPNRGDLRTNYAERTCNSPVAIDPGVSPQWPFVALDGGFEQPTGIFRPPIVVDWETGRIRYFSELVTVRNQNCSYSIYSIERILPGTLNSPNFETPFAFYDLSGEGVGYPNLLLRPQRAIKNEPFILQGNPETQSIRYSWRNEVGDWEWDYKVDVMGHHRYDFETPIADGAALIDAPPYDVYPSWVMGRSWPAVAFVATESTRYRSSEGLYEWSMLGLTEDYFFGWREEPDLSQFQDIRTGLRGEYRLDSMYPPETYLSPIDNRLHLKWAEHGIWRLDDEQIVRVANLDNDEFIDVWSREAMMVTVEDDARTAALSDTEPTVGHLDNGERAEREPGEPEVIEALYALDGNLLHSGNGRVTLVVADYEPALFETLPPTDHETWETHRALLAPYETQRRDPADLRGWLDAFPGPRSEIVGGALQGLRIVDDGFRFELRLEAGYRATGNDLIGVAELAPGEYVVEYRNDAFTIIPLGLPELSLEVKRFSEDVAALPLQAVVTNNGVGDAFDLVLVAEGVDRDGAVTELTREPVDALAGQTARVLLTMPNSRHISRLTIRLEDAEGGVMAAAETTGLATVKEIEGGVIYRLNQAPVLIPVLAGFGALLAAALLLAVRAQREGSGV